VRTWADELGYGPGPVTVYDRADALALLRDAAGRAGIDPDRWPAREFGCALERHRLRGDDADPEGLAGLAGAYEVLLRRRSAVDYPGMLALPLRLFAEHPPALRLLQDAQRHVLADEGQDLCPPQQALLRLLCARHRNLVVVGDPFQCVFSWRGADARFVESLHRDFPEARVVQLTENFRATGRLVDLANALGAPLGDRRLWTRNPPGRPAVLHGAADEHAEAAYVAEQIVALCRAGLVDHPGEVAVVYRTNRQADELALALRARRIPYRVRGVGDPFARREVRDALAYLRLARDPADGAALARIVNSPPRRLGRLAAVLWDSPRPTAELPALARAFGAAALAAAESLEALVGELHAASRCTAPDALLRLALERSAYGAWLAEQPDGTARARHLDALHTLAARAGGDLGRVAGRGRGRARPASRGSGRAPHHDPPGQGRGVARGVRGRGGGRHPPHARALAGVDGASLEEELRTLYVAVTRACERLFVTFARTRQLGGRATPRQRSRFLRGLPAAVLAPAQRAA
jgi:DNA helicase-2/ATP-dependent DNA helicase PcrA